MPAVYVLPGLTGIGDYEGRVAVLAFLQPDDVVVQAKPFGLAGFIVLADAHDLSVSNVKNTYLIRLGVSLE